jgi:surface antigen
MRRTTILLAALAAVLAAPLARADKDDDQGRGHGHGHGHGKHKEEFWDGNCKVTREWKKDGEYKEKRKCKAPERVVVVPAPAVPVQQVYAHPPWMDRQEGQYVYRPQYRPAPVAGTFRCNSATVGRVLGGIVGGTLGNQIGKGDGRTLATIGGAVAGVLIGGEVGTRMDAQNQACVGEVLEVAPVNSRVQWVEGPANYVVVPGQVQYLQGSYCRPYRLEVKTEHGLQRTNGTACRRPDGVWIAH